MPLAVAFIAAGTAISAIGTVKAGRAAKRAGHAQQAVAEAEAQLAEYNAGVADVEAQDAIERGAWDEGRYRAEVRGMIGEQRVSFAGQGISVASGSAADVQADTAYLGELDALQIRSNARREAWGYEVQAYDSRVKAFIDRKAGVAAVQAGNATGNSMYLSAAGGVLSTAGNLLALNAGFNKPGDRTT